MNDNGLRQVFLRSANEWIGDFYWVNITYLVFKSPSATLLSAATISLNPLPPEKDYSFQIETENLVAGNANLSALSNEKIIELLNNASLGSIEVDGKNYFIAGGVEGLHSDMIDRGRWYQDLHLRVNGSNRLYPPDMDINVVDDQIRRCDPPFDGIQDVASWLGLPAPSFAHVSPRIEIRIGPPVDLLINRSTLIDDEFTLIFHAHPRLDVSRIGVAVRAVPGTGLESRKQVASSIAWSDIEKNRKQGIAKLHLNNADSAIAILMIGQTTVRRNWFLDPTKAHNKRLVAIQLFDKDLRMLRQAVIDGNDPAKFETGVNALLFLLGFSSAVLLETQAPDLVVTAPSGRIILVECTLKFSDFSSKMGKLFDRRNALAKKLKTSADNQDVYAVLVCALPRDQIVILDSELAERGLLLITREDLVAAFDQVRMHNDPDEMLDNLVAKYSKTDK